VPPGDPVPSRCKDWHARALPAKKIEYRPWPLCYSEIEAGGEGEVLMGLMRLDKVLPMCNVEGNSNYLKERAAS
jgi:hypothetical protein